MNRPSSTLFSRSGAIAVLSLAIALSGGQPSVAATHGTTGAQMLRGLPDLALDPKGFTLGGKTAPWGGTIVVNYFNTSSTQKYRVLDGRCLFDYSYGVQNIGTAAFTQQQWGQLGSDEIKPGPGEFLNQWPTLAAGASGSASGWFVVGPGTHTLTVFLSRYVPEVTYANNTGTVTVKVTGQCPPQYNLTAPAVLHVAPAPTASASPK
jgi:hypothetical protein